jgi:hypothetical protein
MALADPENRQRERGKRSSQGVEILGFLQSSLGAVQGFAVLKPLVPILIRMRFAAPIAPRGRASRRAFYRTQWVTARWRKISLLNIISSRNFTDVRMADVRGENPGPGPKRISLDDRLSGF